MVLRSLITWFIAVLLFYSALILSYRNGAANIKLVPPIFYVRNPQYNLPKPQIRKVAENTEIVVPLEQLTPEEWGVAKQIDDVTWTIKVGQDEQMGTPKEILAALNVYRNRHAANSLEWDTNLASYAQERAAYFASIKGLDQHKGFIEYTKSEENMRKLGFWGVGENASYGYTLEATHLIEWVFAGDEPHDKNQRDTQWTHVGIGVEGSGVAIIFGKWKT